MIYLDNGATSFHKPPEVANAMRRAMFTCANPGRGGYPAAMAAAKTVLDCREQAADLFDCKPEQVVFTSNCTHGLNMAIATLVSPGATVVVSGFEHNAVIRPLYRLGARIRVAGRKLFDPEDTLEAFEKALKEGADAAVFTHISNVFGYILPVAEMAALCRSYGVPFVVDAAQSAGILPVQLQAWGADFIAMPGHKGLLGPQGTGILLCNKLPEPILSGGTGSASKSREMPDFLPDRGEAGTLNVPGIAGLGAALKYLYKADIQRIAKKEAMLASLCADSLEEMGFTVFRGKGQSGTVSFLTENDCETVAQALAEEGIALRAGLHCAPLAHESAGTLKTGTLRVSFGHDGSREQIRQLIFALRKQKNF